ncbi:MAG: GTPase Era [Cytophagaceae bacterium]|jgi:GTP-binding protein Era|nr:GTPase Era [Cytophagaceae bacterium]
MNQGHKAGFVSIIGRPNAGKSTLMNVLVGENLSIITAKAQTTRHRIMGILSGEHFQVVYSDTPGIIEPKYELHRSMMSFVNTSLEDADVILFVTDIHEKYSEDPIVERLQRITNIPMILLINKIDRSNTSEVENKCAEWKIKLPNARIIPISALEKFNTEQIFPLLLELLPEHPAFFPKDELTDKNERFFASEIIREKIFTNYDKEIPYSCEVVVTSFKEEPKIIRIAADIYVEKNSQKGILIGHKGEALKKVGTEARLDMEKFFGKKVFLETYVRIEEDWRNKERGLNKFGYNPQ